MSTSWSTAEHDYDPEFEDVPDKSSPYDLPTERLAIVSLVAGIAGFFLPVVGPVTAVVSGHVARGEIRKSNGRLGGDALARTGLILGYLWIGLTVLTIVAMLGFTIILVGVGPEKVVVRGEEFSVIPPIESITRPNMVIRRVDDGHLTIEHHREPLGGHDRFPKASVRLLDLGSAQPIPALPNLPDVPELP